MYAIHRSRHAWGLHCRSASLQVGQPPRGWGKRWSHLGSRWWVNRYTNLRYRDTHHRTICYRHSRAYRIALRNRCKRGGVYSKRYRSWSYCMRYRSASLLGWWSHLAMYAIGRIHRASRLRYLLAFGWLDWPPLGAYKRWNHQWLGW